MLDALIHEPAAPATSAIVWLHGLGADGGDFAPLVPHLALPRTRFVFPHAPAIPVTINGGYVMPAWYDIRTLDFRATDRESPEGVARSAEQVRELIAREVARGVPEERIALAGFSQGGAMALHVGIRHPRPLAGVLVMSAYLVLPERLDAEATDAGKAHPWWFAHGTQDPTVPVEGGRSAHQRVQALGAPSEWREYAMGHEVNGDEIRDARTFLARVLGQ